MKARLFHWRDWPLGAKSAIAIAVPLTMLLLALLFSYRLQQQLSTADAQVRRALAIQTDIQTLHSLIAEAATGVRGYLLTGRDDFLQPYRLSQDELPATLIALRRNIRDPEVMSHLVRISELWQRKQASLEELRLQGRQMSPVDLQAHLIGSKGVLDELRAEVQAMYVREAELVREYTAAASEAFRRNLWVNVVTSALVLLSGICAFLLLYSSVVWRVKRLASNAEKLSRDELLEALPAGRDELGLLAERLQNASVLLATRAAEARSASLAKTQFLSRTSHELRTPLNAILGFAQLLEVDLAGTAQAAQVEHVRNAGRHLLTLIDEVLDIARIESGDLKLNLEPQCLATLAQEAVDLLRPLADRQSIELRLTPKLAGLVVLADRQRLRQVLINLLSNAVKYNRPGGVAEIDAEPGEDQVLVAVRDTGVGIRSELLPRLFAPFERLEAEQAGVEGTGLGLALSRQLMLHMGGDIEVRSVLGQGSVFTLRLQRARRGGDAAAALPVSEAGRVAATAADARIALVIEDNASNRALMQALFSRRPQWRIVSTKDGESGLLAARDVRPHLVFLDLHLPGLDGEAVLAALRADAALAATPVIIVSADALPETRERLLASGAADYLTKPLEVARFLSLLDRFAS